MTYKTLVTREGEIINMHSTEDLNQHQLFRYTTRHTHNIVHVSIEKSENEKFIKYEVSEWNQQYLKLWR